MTVSDRQTALVLLAGVLLLGAATPAAAQLDLAGTWHVLVHYTDQNTNNPDILRWDDRVWEFEHKRNRLAWIEYPIVVFGDETGRFERRATGQHARVLGAWEPNDGQLADIRSGLKINTRGVTEKLLRGSDDQGWSTSGRARRGSASVITFEKSWRIEDPTGLPRFIQEDTLGGAGGTEAEGATRYETTEVEPDGSVLRGSFDRDGTRRGTFVMRRSAATGRLELRPQAAIQQEAARRSLQTDQSARRALHEMLQASLAENGISLAPDQVDRISNELIEMYVRGASTEKVERYAEELVRREFFGFVRDGAAHDAAARYALPFDSPAPRQLSQGVGGDADASGFRAGMASHKGRFRYAFDFAMPVGTSIVAARAGEVVLVVDGYERGGPMQGLASKANAVFVQHDDGSFAAYAHLSKGIVVAPGDRVEAGTRLGLSGNTGYTSGPHLHFDVRTADDEGDIRSVSIRFGDGSVEGFVPVQGAYYGGRADGPSAARRPSDSAR